MPTIDCKNGCGTRLSALTQGNKTIWVDPEGVNHGPICPNKAQPKAEEKKVEVKAKPRGGAIEQLLGQLSEELLAGTDIEALKASVNEVASKLGELEAIRTELKEAQERREVRIIPPKGEPKDMGRQHKDFEKLVRMLASRRIDGFPVNVWATGPAGGGKTSGFLKAFEALGCKNVEIVSLNQETSNSNLFGYRTATGEHIESALYRIYTEGGGMLFDEFDAANANTVTQLNAALDNGLAAFPTGTVKRHPDSYFGVAGNTFGLGPDGTYIGRAKLDAATRRRFAFLHWGYDWSLFKDLIPDRKDIVLHMEKVAKVVDKLKLEAIASPAQCLNAAALMDGGFSFDEAFEAVLWAPMKRDDREKVKANL